MTSSTSNEEWIDCNFVGIIKKYDIEPKSSSEPYEIVDDYDMRNGLGGRFHNFKSRLDRMEC